MTPRAELVDDLRRRLVAAVHAEWIADIRAKTSWPEDGIVDILVAADCDRTRLYEAFSRFNDVDDMNPFVEPPVHVRFLRFLQR